MIASWFSSARANGQATLLARGTAGLGGQKGLDPFPDEPAPDHPSTQSKDIHVVILDTLMNGGEFMAEV